MAQKTDTQEITDEQFSIFSAYQHFLYWINVDHLRSNTPWNDHMTDHLMSKLKGIQSIENSLHMSVSVVVYWVQEMTPHFQKALMGYIIKYHSNK